MFGTVLRIHDFVRDSSAELMKDFLDIKLNNQTHEINNVRFCIKVFPIIVLYTVCYGVWLMFCVDVIQQLRAI